MPQMTTKTDVQNAMRFKPGDQVSFVGLVHMGAPDDLISVGCLRDLTDHEYRNGYRFKIFDAKVSGTLHGMYLLDFLDGRHVGIPLGESSLDDCEMRPPNCGRI